VTNGIEGLAEIDKNTSDIGVGLAGASFPQLKVR